MKLKNKKTGELGTLTLSSDGETFILMNERMYTHSVKLKDLEEWEDVPEDPKEYWYITEDGIPGRINLTWDTQESIKYHKEIGNYFNTYEEAEKAVEKLKAWKRLKDNGFRFDHIRSIDGVTMKHKDLDQYTIIAYADEDSCDQECLDLLFEGVE